MAYGRAHPHASTTCVYVESDRCRPYGPGGSYCLSILRDQSLITGRGASHHPRDRLLTTVREGRGGYIMGNSQF